MIEAAFHAAIMLIIAICLFAGSACALVGIGIMLTASSFVGFVYLIIGFVLLWAAAFLFDWGTNL